LPGHCSPDTVLRCGAAWCVRAAPPQPPQPATPMTPALAMMAPPTPAPPTPANNLQLKLEAVQDQLAASSSPAFTPMAGARCPGPCWVPQSVRDSRARPPHQPRACARADPGTASPQAPPAATPAPTPAPTPLGKSRAGNANASTRYDPIRTQSDLAIRPVRPCDMRDP
jgi:hypothetical protein